MDWIQTYSGKKFYPLDPRPEDIDIRDIAHALSLNCRFNGHCRCFYSVAEHSVGVSSSQSPDARKVFGRQDCRSLRNFYNLRFPVGVEVCVDG